MRSKKERSVVGFDDYTTMDIDPGYFRPSGTAGPCSLVREPNYWDNNRYRLPLREVSCYRRLNAWDADYTNVPEIWNRRYEPKDGDSLFFDKNCTMPRVWIEGRWKRASCVAKADAVVIPKFYRVPCCDNRALFVDDVNKVIYFLDCYGYDTFPEPGDTFLTYRNKMASQLNSQSMTTNAKAFELIQDIPCAYFGTLIEVRPCNEFMVDAVDGMYPKIAFEEDLVKTLQPDSEPFTLELVDSMKDALKSGKKDSIKLAMTALANMDWQRFPSVATYILGETEWSWRPCKSDLGRAAKTMLDGLDYKLGRARNYFSKVGRDEAEICAQLMRRNLISAIGSKLESIDKRSNMKVKVYWDVSVGLDEETPPENGREYTEAEIANSKQWEESEG